MQQWSKELQQAFEREDATSIISIIKQGYPQDRCFSWLQPNGVFGYTTPLIKAVELNSIEIVNFLIDRHCQINAKNSFQQTALHVACFKGYFDLVLLLTLRGQADWRLQDKDGNTSLHLASLNMHMPIIKFLNERLGADMYAKNYFGRNVIGELMNAQESTKDTNYAQKIQIVLDNKIDPDFKFKIMSKRTQEEKEKILMQKLTNTHRWCLHSYFRQNYFDQFGISVQKRKKVNKEELKTFKNRNQPIKKKLPPIKDKTFKSSSIDSIIRKRSDAVFNLTLSTQMQTFSRKSPTSKSVSNKAQEHKKFSNFEFFSQNDIQSPQGSAKSLLNSMVTFEKNVKDL